MRKLTTTVIALAGLMAIAAAPVSLDTGGDGGSTTVTYEESETTFNLRRENCGGEEANRTYLSTTSGEDSGDGCGTIGGVAPILNEAVIQVDGVPLLTDVFAASDGLPFRIDANRDINGVLTFGQFKGLAENPASFGAGNMVVDLTLQGRTSGGFAFKIETTGEALALPAQGTYEVPFTFELPDGAHEQEIATSLSLEVAVRGPNVGQDYLHTSHGVSNFVFPTLVEVTEAE